MIIVKTRDEQYHLTKNQTNYTLNIFTHCIPQLVELRHIGALSSTNKIQ